MLLSHRRADWEQKTNLKPKHKGPCCWWGFQAPELGFSAAGFTAWAGQARHRVSVHGSLCPSEEASWGWRAPRLGEAGTGGSGGFCSQHLPSSGSSARPWYHVSAGAGGAGVTDRHWRAARSAGGTQWGGAEPGLRVPLSRTQPGCGPKAGPLLSELKDPLQTGELCFHSS